MDFLNQAYSQLVGLFRSMTPAARITTGLLLVAVVVSFTFLFQTKADVADGFLFGAQFLSQRELDAMAAAFGKAGLGNFQVKQQRMMVPPAQRAAYLKALSDNGALPEHPGVAAEQMLANQSALESRDTRDQRARHVKQKDLETILRGWTGIRTAFVLINEIDNGGFRAEKELHAGVSVQMEGNVQMTERLAKSIRSLVAYGAGMAVEDVAVHDEKTGRSYGGSEEEGGLLGARHEYAEAQREYEREVKQKIEKYLSFIQDVAVTVYVDLEKNLATQTESRKFDAKPVTIRSSEYAKDSTSTTPQSRGRPGFSSNGGGNQSVEVDSTAAAETTSNEKRDEVDNVAGQTREMTQMAGLVPKAYQVSIAIPKTYFLKVWREEHPVPPGEEPPVPPVDELNKVEEDTLSLVKTQVANIMPPLLFGQDGQTHKVDVQAYTPVSAELAAGPSFVDNATSWFAGNWQTIGMFGFAIFGMSMLRGMIRSAQNDPSPGSVQTIPLNSLSVHNPEGESPSEEGDEEGEDAANSLRARFQHSGRSLRDELTELVREDPDAAASVLQNWIGDAA